MRSANVRLSHNISTAAKRERSTLEQWRGKLFIRAQVFMPLIGSTAFRLYSLLCAPTRNVTALILVLEPTRDACQSCAGFVVACGSLALSVAQTPHPKQRSGTDFTL